MDDLGLQKFYLYLSSYVWNKKCVYDIYKKISFFLLLEVPWCNGYRHRKWTQGH